MSRQAQIKKSAWDKMCDWFAKPGVKKVVGPAYAFGAAVVIVGALFKIMHWPGAGLMLTIGMSAEVVLFLLGMFDKPHPEYHWDNVYPQLLDGHGHNTAPSAPTAQSVVSNNVAQASVSSALSESDAKKLSDSIKNIAETANQLTSISKVAGVTDEYVKSITAASTAAAKYAVNQNGVDEAASKLLNAYSNSAQNMEAMQQNTKDASLRLKSINDNLGSLNSLYELQLTNVKSQSESLNTYTNQLQGATNGVAKMATLIEGANNEIVQYKQAVSSINKKVQDLDKVYGGMLSAVSN